MKLITEWKRAYRMVSVQSMALAAAIQGTWPLIPDDMKASIPHNVVHWVSLALLGFGIAGRLVVQPKVKEPTSPKGTP
jgi:hypothetical protein